MSKGRNCCGFYLVTLNSVRIPIRCIKVRFEINARVGGFIYMLHGVYVTKEYRKFAIFSKLFDKTYQLAKEDKNWNEILLFVDIDNKIVQSVYSKLGLQNSGYSFYEEDFLFPDHLKSAI